MFKTSTRKTLLAMTALCGLAASASAQYTAPNFNVNISTTEWNSVTLNGASIPAATYTTSRVRFNFTPGNINSADSDAVWALTDTQVVDGFTLNGTVYANRGSAPNATGNSAAILLDWPAANLDTNYPGAAPLWFAYRHTFPGSTGSWANVQVTLGGATPPPAPPTNDAAANAVNIASIPYTSPPIDVGGASNDPAGDPPFACVTNVRRTIWYTFTPTTSGQYTISTCSADAPGTTVADTVAGVYTFDGVNYTAVGCNNDSACGARANLTATLSAGTQYFIVLGRAGTDASLPLGESAISFNLAEFTAPVGAANDDCSNAIVIPATTTNSYVSAVVDITNATRVNEPVMATCTDNISRTIWWKFTPAQTGDYTLSTCAADVPGCNIPDTYLAVFSGACGGLTQVGCNDDGDFRCTTLRTDLKLRLNAGTDYYIMGAKYGTGAPAAGESNFQFAFVDFVAPPTPPSNDNCAGAINVNAQPGFALPFTSTPLIMTGAGTTAAEPAFTCNGTTAVGYTAWYSFQPSASDNYIISTTSGEAGATNVPDTIIGVYTSSNPADPCNGTFTSVACNDNGTGRARVTVPMTAGTRYFFMIGRKGTGVLGAAETTYQFQLLVAPPPPTCNSPEAEPNDNKAAANAITLAAGQSICGSAVGESDYFKVKTATAPGITRYRLNLTSNTLGHVVSLRGLTQTAGVPTTTETELRASSTTDQFVQWYGLGSNANPDDRSMYVRVLGNAASIDPYFLTLATTTITPVDIGGSPLTPGSITITSVGQTGGAQTDTDLWIYDSNFNPIVDWGNDDAFGSTSLGSTLTRTFTDGTYYLAISRYNLANNLGSPADDDFRTGSVTDFTSVVCQSLVTYTPPLNLSVQITDTAGPRSVALSASEANEVVFAKLVVGTPGPARCNPADIADDQGNPLPGPPNVPNNNVNEGDFNAFFSAGGFFAQSAMGNAAVGMFCDIADDQGTANPPFGTPLGSNGGVNEGDYNCFFNNLFLPCV